ncbi:MAG: pentapeptide repeat-containing protein [Opitutales bacterium]|nr:pentapeptide repeat-containing protein [Opitutales bacterium]
MKNDKQSRETAKPKIKTYPVCGTKKLKEIIEKHKLWLQGKAGGERADLRDADLRKADLRDAYLRGADLRKADLRAADLSGAYLRGAYLRDAYLRGANLREAALRGADLSGAYLRDADLSGADLRDADLRDADLRRANLRGADLRGADLRGAHLRGAYLSDANTGVNIIISAGYIGSRHDETIYNATQDCLQCGCFVGTLDEFKAKVAETYPDKDNLHRREYEAAIVYFEAVSKARKETNNER